MHLPSAVINVAPGHTEYLEVRTDGDQRTFYEWSLTLKISIDQHVERRSFGTRSNPLRDWMGIVPNHLYVFSPTSNSWNRKRFW